HRTSLRVRQRSRILRCLSESTIRGTNMTAVPHSAADLPVRPGEDPWSDAELAELRIELEKEAVELRAELGDSQAQIAARLGDAATEAGDDEADTSSKLFEREHESTLSNNTPELLEQTEE